MSYKLTNEAGEIFYCDAIHLISFQELAIRQGWQPEGGDLNQWLLEKMSPHCEDETSSIPVVSSLDAITMGAKLKQLFDRKFSDNDFPEFWEPPHVSPVWATMTLDVSKRTPTRDRHGKYHESDISRTKYWSQHLDALREFISFLYRGSYRIESFQEYYPKRQGAEISKKNPNPDLNPKR